ncbi:MAG: (d)CMP kinase, partial [Gemmatimonadales bacterium]
PAGSGKSTTAKAVARKLGLAHLDSGALYRSATLAVLDAGAELTGQKIVALARSLPIGLRLSEKGYRPEVAGVDVSREIRSDRVTARVSGVSALPELRQWVNQTLREAAALHPKGVVVDGRDIGTVVFPDAAVKVYLTADGDERARRRLRQLGRSTDSKSVERANADIAERDRKDSTRAVAPLTKAEDAVLLDTTNLTFEEQVALVVGMGRKAFQ